MNLVGPITQAAVNQGAQDVFDTFKRPFSLYIEAQVVTISTSPAYSRFGQHDQNVFNPQVNPQVYTVYGTILYGNNQPWEFIEPQARANFQQTKLRNSQGLVRIKVDESGYALMQNCKLANLDGFNFTMTSNARPHGMFGIQRYTFWLTKTD